ncbi:sensor histidine kinase [Allonocardiopsis opalescens]|uniref:histidine kinase n=1 Tax=Allonocardiopsis opalescens TaxID=1144618 RepID=A0A2T0PU01_9ACTN|nr:HAMP domain-containing sensor histidine kinase [Allonocardiopsis opalescens]PRX92373.1 signal transduction histidine kinase [Allonocardiopsis opalescens]
MRRRLLGVLLAFSVVAVACFAVPLLTALSDERTKGLELSRTADLAWFAMLAKYADESGSPMRLQSELLSFHALYGEDVLVVDSDRNLVASAGDIDAGQDEVPHLIDVALRGGTTSYIPSIWPWSSEDVLLARPFGTGIGVSGAIVMRASVDQAAADVAVKHAMVLTGAVVAMGVCALLCGYVTRWVLRPLANLERGVRALAEGRSGAEVPDTSGPPELRDVVSSFNRMSRSLAEAAATQAQLVADASHQLRNPMAALRLRIDAMGGWVPPERDRSYQAVLREVERLEHLMDGLLKLALADSKATSLAAPREAAAGEPALPEAGDEVCDVAVVLPERLDAWRDIADAGGVHLASPSADDGEPVPIRMAESEFAQVLDIVIDNAVKHAGAGATVRTEVRADGPEAYLQVTDDGPGLPAAELPLATRRFWRSTRGHAPGSGLGLTIAERLVVARKGRFELRRVDPHGLSVRIAVPMSGPAPLPRARAQAATARGVRQPTP